MRKNLFALYGVQVATLVLPLLSIPFLARVLGPSALGELAAIQSLFATLGFLIEYGFNFSATRQAAIHQHDRDKLTEILGNVLGAKILLSLLFLLISLAVYFFVPVFRSHPTLFWLGFVGALAQGFNLMWFYQGIEKLSLAATVDILCKSAYIALLFLFVRSPRDLTLVIGFQSASFILSLLVNAFCSRQYSNSLSLSFSGSLEALKEGSSMFLFRGMTLFYTTANSALLRLYVPAATVAYYSNAERLTNVGFSAFAPLNQVFFPRLSYLVHHDFQEAKKFFRKCFYILTPLSIASAVIAYIASPLAVEILFGEEYSQTSDIFRILLINIPLISISSLFGLQWLVPNGMQKQFNIAIGLSAVINIVSVITVVPIFKAVGMAWTIVACELVIMSVILVNVLRHPTNPFLKDSSIPPRTKELGV